MLADPPVKRSLSLNKYAYGRNIALIKEHDTQPSPSRENYFRREDKSTLNEPQKSPQVTL